ncbi:MAG: glycosyltransferase family 4 protein [Bernardetiaceae bacterium]|jgi:glycosyltransferase involved in cell wall biosynthesis|nr:glycosyltransferase family 4 protein [Bernardetiaceae bacterium]
MRFLIVTHVEHTQKGAHYYAYGPYVWEMNLWAKYCRQLIIVAPLAKSEAVDPIAGAYRHIDIRFLPVPIFDTTTWWQALRTLVLLPWVAFQIIRGMALADHLHLRCPGNLGLLGCCLQFFFPSKPKTVKYAGNWGNYPGEPRTYQWQKKLMSNPCWARHTKVLVYGRWPAQSPNIIPFFTASYHQTETPLAVGKPLSGPLQLVFVGTLTPGKRPDLAIEVTARLLKRGQPAQLTLLGDGPERNRLARLIDQLGLGDRIKLLGNVDKPTLATHYQQAHFLVFLSKSEGWPKVVAEAMWWGCVPVTTPVSCVPWMLGSGQRGLLANPNADEVAEQIAQLLAQPAGYLAMQQHAAAWAHQYTLERFEQEIAQLLR